MLDKIAIQFLRIFKVSSAEADAERQLTLAENAELRKEIQRNEELRQQLERIRSELTHAISDLDRQSPVQDELESETKMFRHAVSERIPAITEMELELCGYIRLGLSNMEIAERIRKAPSSIRAYKARLKQKAGMASIREMERMIREI